MKQFPCKGKNKSLRSKLIKCLHCKDRHAGLDIFKKNEFSKELIDRINLLLLFCNDRDFFYLFFFYLKLSNCKFNTSYILKNLNNIQNLK